LLNTSYMSVDLCAVDHNVGVLREALSRGPGGGGGEPVRICAVIKADAYGLGAVRVAHRLEKAGVEMLGVYTLAEAVELLGASVRTPVLVMSPVRSIADSDTLYRAVSHGRLHFTVHSLEQASLLGKQADRFGVEIPVHVDVNTGLNRGGTRVEECGELFELVLGHRRLVLSGVSTHFQDADRDGAGTRAQGEKLAALVREYADRLPGVSVLHAANTSGAFRSGGLHFGMVRVGYAVAGYGADAFGARDEFELAGLADTLRPALRWVSSVCHLQWVEPGERVGYGAEWEAERRSLVALVPVGYADGYPFSLTNRGVVRVLAGGELVEAPVIGRVSMDQITVDVTGLGEKSVGIGSEVELIGRDVDAATHLPRVAAAAGTISHELLCRLSRRVPRRYESSREPAGAVVTRRVAPAGTSSGAGADA